MAKQQSKKRQKKYQAGSAYAGHVKPTGVMGFLSSGAMIKLIFIGMALALVIGGGVTTIFGTDLFRDSGNATEDNFVVPGDENDPTPTPQELVFEAKQYSAEPPITIDPNATYTATIRTDDGDITVELSPDQALEAVNSFVFLADDGFYNGLTFHFVEPGFSAQAGDPYCSVDAPAGVCRRDGGPGYELTETVEGDFTAGTLGMINGSQFFIALTESSQFDGLTPFGHVTSGLDVAEQLTANTPIRSIDIAVQ
jgi:cyclophilin family peptidyl-prolyl cis-trans isomerase